MKFEQFNNSNQEPEGEKLAQISKPALIKEVRRLRKENKLLREKDAQPGEKLERITDKLEKGNVPNFKPNGTYRRTPAPRTQAERKAARGSPETPYLQKN